jgi:hypothetical protein
MNPVSCEIDAAEFGAIAKASEGAGKESGAELAFGASLNLLLLFEATIPQEASRATDPVL